MKNILKLTLLVLISGSCKKEIFIDKKNTEIIHYHSIRFLVYLQDTSQIDAVATERAVYFPIKDRSYIQTATFIRTFNNFSDKIETPYMPQNDSVYPGVHYQLGINVMYKDGRGDKYGNNFWKLPVDTVRTAADSIVTFHYPEDTVKCRKYDWLTGLPL